tara:strand:- start:20942 stop:22471 length:1530 start_codon:yes stop_codon:yes gene_type:complete
MSAFQNQQPLNPVSPMVSQHIAEGDKAAAREKDRNESARQANMQDATTRQMTREQIMARQKGFADKQASDERMQRNEQEFSAIQSSQDREYREKVAMRTLKLEQAKHEAIMNASKARGDSLEASELEIQKIEDELVEIGAASARADLGLQNSRSDFFDRAGRIAGQIEDRAENLQGFIDEATATAANLPFQINSALAERLKGEKTIFQPALEASIKEMVGFPSIGLEPLDGTVKFLAGITMLADDSINAIADGLGIDYTSANETLRSSSVSTPQTGIRTVARIVADNFSDLTDSNPNSSDEENKTSLARNAGLHSLVVQILSDTGVTDRQIRSQLGELGVDPETFGTFMFHAGETIRSASAQTLGEIDPNDENFDVSSYVPASLNASAIRMVAFGRKTRGMTPESLNRFATRLTSPDDLFTASTAEDSRDFTPYQLREDDQDQGAGNFASDLLSLIERTRESEGVDALAEVEETAALEQRIERMRRDAERDADRAALDAGGNPYDEFFP